MTTTITTVAEGIAALVDADALVDRLEEQLKAAKKAKYELETITLPNVFADAGEVEATLASGAKAKLGQMITGSLPKVDYDTSPEVQAATIAKREAAIEWADANGWGPLIKCEVRAKWDKGDRDKAIAAYNALRGDNSVDLHLLEDIHPMTLQSQVRQRIAQGLPVPLETLGVTVLPAVRLTKKPKKDL